MIFEYNTTEVHVKNDTDLEEHLNTFGRDHWDIFQLLPVTQEVDTALGYFLDKKCYRLFMKRVKTECYHE